MPKSQGFCASSATVIALTSGAVAGAPPRVGAVVCDYSNGFGNSVHRPLIARASKQTTMSPKPHGPYLYTVTEAAEYLRISERTMRKLIAESALRYRRTGSAKRGRIVFLQSDQ